MEEPPEQPPPEQPEFRPPRQDEIVLWGPILTVHYRATLGDLEDETPYRMYTQDRAGHDELVTNEVRGLAETHLGPGFDVRVTAAPGSLFLGLEIVASGYAVYKAIGEYPQFRAGLLRLIDDMYVILEDLVGLGITQLPVRLAELDVRLGPSVVAADTYAMISPVVKQLRNFLVYISVITTALLICGLILLLTLLL